MAPSRRELLVGAGAVAVASALPALPAVAGPLPSFPVFEVGVEEVPNWRMIAAETAERAMQIFREDIGLCEGCDGLRCAELDPDYDCEHRGLDARKLSEKVVPAQTAEGDIAAGLPEMLAAGWRYQCSRCYYDEPDQWFIVEDHAVCDDCLTAHEQHAISYDCFLHRFINNGYDTADPAILALLKPEDLADPEINPNLTVDQ